MGTPQEAIFGQTIECSCGQTHKVEPREIRHLGLSPNRYVLYVGRLSPEKGVHHLVSAFRRLATSCKLVLAGSACHVTCVLGYVIPPG